MVTQNKYVTRFTIIYPTKSIDSFTCVGYILWWIIKVNHPLLDIFRHKYITHEDEQYNTHIIQSHYINIFIRDIFFLYMLFGRFSYCI